MSNDVFGWSAASSAEATKGFVIEVDGERAALACREVRGLDEAKRAAFDRDASPPHRLVLVAPDDALSAWLAAWSLDTDRVRRSLTIRGEDGVGVTAVSTLASYGYGVDTSLTVESVSSDEGPSEIYRSGVHTIADLARLLGGDIGP